MDFHRLHWPERILSVLFALYLILKFPLPAPVAEGLDTSLGKIAVMVVALFLMAYTHPVLGVLSLLVAYQLIYRASVQTGTAGLAEYYPTEEKKWSPFTPVHQFPYTLEQEMVKKMTTQNFNTEYVKAPFRPSLDDTHEATML